MKLVQTIKELQSELDALRSEGKTIGLVPTMGALHAGHASLVKRAVAENDVVVVSDFVNPTQFNDKNDLAKYPRTLDADCELLEKVGAAFVFAPSVEEIYPEPDTRQFSYAPLDTVMEGRFRPGHFNGVCQIVSKLFMIVNPTRAYFGEKDFQQLAIIREMVKQIGFNGLEIVGCPIVREEDGLALSSRNARLSAVEREYALNISQTLFKSCTFAKSHPVAETQKFVGCPIVREEDGLALSSRNARLSAVEREYALNISQTLFKSCTFAKSHPVAETQKFVEDAIAAAPGLRLEYFEIVDGTTLQKITDWEDTDYAVGCITVFCGEVRLIDNIKYKG